MARTYFMEKPPLFADRQQAGRLLAAELAKRGFARPVIYALPRGGVPVALEVARALNAPLDLIMVRKIGAPSQPELAVGALVDGEAPTIVWNKDVLAGLNLRSEQLSSTVEAEHARIARRRALYLTDRPAVSVRGHEAVIVDDGVATGASMRAAATALRMRAPSRIVLAAPVAALDTAKDLRRFADDVVILRTPADFRAVGCWYVDFRQIQDRDVIDLLAVAPGASEGT